MKKFILTTAVLGLTACASSELSSGQSADIAEFANLLDRNFETSPENTENNILDQRVRVASDALEGYWYYTQLNTGAERKLYRQRISHIKISDDGTAIIQRAYGLIEPEKYVDAWTNTKLLKSLTHDDFKSYFDEGCEQVWEVDGVGGWTGYVDPKTCIVSSKRRNKDIRIESEAYLSKDFYRTNERGYEMDMTFIWGTQPGEYIDLYPVEN